jgi:SAM-dependent methyltransferase
MVMPNLGAISQEPPRAAVFGDLEAQCTTALSEQGWDVTLVRRDGADLGGTPQDVSMTRYDGDEVALADDYADSVALIDALEYAVDDVALIAEARRILRPNGFLIVRVPLTGRLAWLDARNICRYVTETTGRGSPFPEMAGAGFRRHYDRQEITELITDAGFMISKSQSSALGLSELIYLVGSTLVRVSSPYSRFPRIRGIYAHLDRLETRLPFGTYYLTILAQRLY